MFDLAIRPYAEIQRASRFLFHFKCVIAIGLPTRPFVRPPVRPFVLLPFLSPVQHMTVYEPLDAQRTLLPVSAYWQTRSQTN